MAKKLQLRRGTTSQHSSFTGAIGEVTVDTDKKVVVVHDGSTAGGIPLSKASDAAELIDEDDFSSNSATKVPSQQSAKAYIAATSQPLDADLTSLAGCQTGAAAALAALTSTEVAIIDGATLTTAELNYVDGVTSAIQTQLDTKAALTADQSWSGSQRGTISDVGTKTANFDFDLNTANNFKMTIGADAKEFGFTNITAGQSGTIEVVNGAYTLSYGAEIHFVGGTAPVLTQSATSFLAYYCPSGTVVFVQHMLDVKAQS